MSAAERALALELSCRYLQPLLDLAAPFDAELPSLLAAWDVTLPQLRDETNWVSLRFCEALTEWLAARVGGDELAVRVAEAAYSPRALGFIYPLLRAFASPRLGYAKLPQFVGVLNKVSRVAVLSIAGGGAELEYRPVSEALRERSPLICRLRREQLAAAPTLWGLPHATVEELECQTRGGERCLYRLTWAERAGWLGTLAGAVGAALLAWLVLPPPLLPWACACGALLGRVVDGQRQQRELRRFNAEQNRALTDAARAMERRFAELEQAKREVDRQVEARTAELQLTSSQLAETVTQLEQLSKVKDEFLANVSHELRTPLTLILGPVGDLLAGGGGAQREELELVQRNALRLNSLVDDLLELARLQAGQLRLAVTEVDVGETVGAVVEQFRLLAARKSIAVGFDPGAQLTIAADPRRLEFVFANLLSNAVKFTPVGGRVDVAVRAGADEVRIEVADSGPGIAAERQARIFDRFARFDAPSAPGGAGSGIGLALVKELVELHGGSVTVRSAPGAGSTFVVTLPRQRAAGRAHADAQRDVPVPVRSQPGRVFLVDDGPAAAPAPDAGAAVDALTDGRSVLVVDDHADMRAFLTTLLGRRYRVEAVASGEAALEAIARRRPDAVVSDVMMPGLSGYDLCRALKQQPATRAIPVVLLTARRDAEWALHGFASGADDYVSKPFHPDELLARIDVQLRLRGLMDDQIRKEKLATLGSLAAGLAHEVRNPVGAILAGLPRLRRELASVELRPAAREMLDVAIDCAQRIDRLVGDLLDLGQPDRDGARLWDPHEGIEAAIRVLSHRAPESVAIHRRFGFAGRVMARPAALNQVFVNLLDNAIAAVAGGGVIEVETAAADRGALFAFSDSGAGIPDELRARVFDPFFTTKEVGRGTGLGLHISRRIVEEHGGTLDVIGSRLHGACFRIWLPEAEAQRA